MQENIFISYLEKGFLQIYLHMKLFQFKFHLRKMLLTNHVERRENKKDKDIFTNVFTKEQVF